MTEVTKRKGRGTARTKGQEIVEGLRGLADALKSDEPLGSRFTVRTYKIAPPPEYRGEGVRRVRTAGDEPGRVRGIPRCRSVDRAVVGAGATAAEPVGLPDALGDRGRPDPLAGTTHGMPCRPRSEKPPLRPARRSA